MVSAMRRGAILLFLFLLLPISAFADQDPAATCATAIGNIKALLQSDFGQFHASVLIQQDDRVFVANNYGKNVTETSHFLLGSTTKPLHAVIAAKLASQGVLGFESAISSELSADLASAVPADWAGVRVRNLLHHTSGIPDYLNRGNPTDQHATDVFLKTAHSFAELIDFLPPKLEFDPDSRYDYSNTNYLILDQILQSRTGLKESELLAQYLITPLQLTDTGRLTDPNTSVYGTTDVYPSNLDGVGNIFSSAHDLMVFLRALDNEQLLSREWVEKLFQPDPECHGPGCDHYGLGFRLYGGLPGHPWVSHTGHLKTVSAVIAKIPDMRTNLVAVSDRPDFNTDGMAENIFAALLKGGCLTTTSPMP